ncbi:MAG: dihydrofolate reductase family protein [Thermotogota bacterium]|nr:dihydrofolate reductase family protein [Thermotogota bacterium]
MKKILIAALSANGKIAVEGGSSSLDWTSKEDTQYFIQRTKEAKNVIMGRKTFETINKPLKDRTVYVLTGNQELLEKQLPDVVFTNKSPETLIKNLEEKGEKECCIVGGKSIYEQFLNLNLVDELHLTVEPIIFKSGTNLADRLEKDLQLELINIEKLNASTILLKYKILKMGM